MNKKSSFVEVRIEDAHLGDLRNGQLAANGSAPHSLGRRPVVKTEGAFAIGGDVGVQPVTPSSAFLSMTFRHNWVPLSSRGM